MKKNWPSILEKIHYLHVQTSKLDCKTETWFFIKTALYRSELQRPNVSSSKYSLGKSELFGITFLFAKCKSSWSRIPGRGNPGFYVKLPFYLELTIWVYSRHRLNINESVISSSLYNKFSTRNILFMISF